MAEHNHPVVDGDVRLKIDPITRKIQSASGKTSLIQGDHNSERFTFEVNRRVDGHDLSLCDVVQVHYINIDAKDKTLTSADFHEVDDLRVSTEDENIVVFSWLIDGKASRYAGTLSFAVKFKCTENGKPVYVWNTAIFSGVSVSNGMDNTGAIVEEYSDVLEQWRQELFSDSGSGSVGVQSHSSGAVRDAGRRITGAMVSFMDDDCRKEVYHRKSETPNEPSLWELIQELGIPYTLACPPGSIYDPDNPVEGNETYLAVGELLEMYKSGVTISCHHWRQYNMDDTELLPTEADYTADLSKCQSTFAKWGIEAETVAYPQGKYRDDFIQVVKDFYRMGFTVDRGINEIPYASYYMHRNEVFPTNGAYNIDDAKELVAEAVNNGGWVIFMTHAWYTTFDASGLRELVEHIREQGVPIVDVHDAIRMTGNVVEVGPVKKPLETMTDSFFIVDCKGAAWTNDLHLIQKPTGGVEIIEVEYYTGTYLKPAGGKASTTTNERVISVDVPAAAGEVYLLTCSAIWGGLCFAVYDADGNLKDSYADTANNETGTSLVDHQVVMPDDVAYFRVSSSDINQNPIVIKRVVPDAI